MGILMAESIYNLFSGKVNLINSNDIDIVIRTTSAAIFGYFLSANFASRSKNKLKNSPKETKVLDKKTIVISHEKTQVTTQKDINDKKELSANNQQIIVATTIGIIALIVLMVARNSIDITDKSIATIAQMRDFVSGCVGFLLGCPTNANRD
jgi:hypothetical protein